MQDLMRFEYAFAALVKCVQPDDAVTCECGWEPLANTAVRLREVLEHARFDHVSPYNVVVRRPIGTF